MPKLIKKNENYFIRAPYNFALRPEGVNELLSKGIEVDDVFDKGFFDYLCNKNWVAIFSEDVQRATAIENSSEDEEIEDEMASDSLSELLNQISAIQKKYSNHGIALEILIKQNARE